MVSFIMQKPNSHRLTTSLILYAETYCSEADDVFDNLFDMFTGHSILNIRKLGSRLGCRAASDKDSLERIIESRWGQDWWKSFGLRAPPYRDILFQLRKICCTNTLSQVNMQVAACLGLKDNPTVLRKATLPTCKQAADQVIALRLGAAQQDLPTSLLAQTKVLFLSGDRPIGKGKNSGHWALLARDGDAVGKYHQHIRQVEDKW
jgi:hypothetical protein